MKILCTLALLTASAVGQSMGSHSSTPTSTLSLVNHIASCASNNCWHQSNAGAAQLDWIFTGIATVYGIDNNGFGYAYQDYPTNQWVEHSEWGKVFSLSSDSAGNIWALYDNGNCPSGGGHSLGRWNGSSFTLLTYCFSQFVLTKDGSDMPFLIDPNGTLWNYTSACGWCHVSVPSPFVAAVSVAAVSPTQFYITRSDRSIWSYNGTSWAQLPGAASLPSEGINVNLAVSADNDLYVIGGSTNKNVYHYNGTGWDLLYLGGFSSVALTDDTGVWGVGTMTNNGVYNDTYRFSEMTFRHTANLQMVASCTGCNHSAYIQAGWSGGGTVTPGGAQMNNFNPNGLFNLADTSDLFDFYSCFEEGQPNCKPHRKWAVVCSIAGLLAPGIEDLLLAAPDSGIIKTSGYVTSVTRHSLLGTYGYCVANNCSPQGLMNVGAPAGNGGCTTGSPGPGGNVTDRMLDNSNTDTSAELQAFCVWDLGTILYCRIPGKIWLPPSIAPGIVTGVIINRNVSIPFNGCDQ